MECPHCGCQCCCTCQHHLPVMYHCTTSPELREKHGGCCCSVQKDWACVAPGMGRVHDNWPEHSCGCELHTPNTEVRCEVNEERMSEVNSTDLLADPPAYCAGMRVILLKSGSLCEFVEYRHGSRCVIRRCDTGKTMVATLAGIFPANGEITCDR